MQARNILALCIGGLLFASQGVRAEPKITTILELPKNVSYEGMTLSGGRLWVGQEFFTTNEPAGAHKVFSIDPANPSDIVTISLPHAPQFLYSLSDGHTLAAGPTAYGVPSRWQSHFSVISGTKVTTQDLPDGYGAGDAEFPNAIFVKRFTEFHGRWFFSLQYGESGIMEWQSGRAPRKLAPHINLPDHVVGVGNSLFVIQKDNVDNIVRITLPDEKSTMLWPQGSKVYLDTMIAVPEKNLVVAAEDSGVYFIDAGTFTVKNFLPMDGTPYGMAVFGSCVLVTTLQGHFVHVVDHIDQTPAIAASWDLSSLGNSFEAPRTIAVEPTLRRVFVRSTRNCSACEHNPNHVIMIEPQPEDLHGICGF